jgi:alpha-aminoadipate carrier protein LysW
MPTVACPECSEEVFIDADTEQGDIVFCDECGADLEVVGLDPVELDIFNDSDYDFEDDDFEEEDELSY